MTTVVYGLSILLQGLATLFALIQIRNAPRRLPWLLMALASFVMVARRVATLSGASTPGQELSAADLLTLLISALFFFGVLLTSRMFDEILQNHLALQSSEEALRTASSYARNLIETSLDPLVTISPEGKITDVNRATEAVTGQTREMLIGSDFSDYFTDPDMARAGYRKVFAQGKVVDYPLAIRHATGRIVDVLYNAALYRNEKGEVLGVFAAARDITDRKRAEADREKLEAENRQLQKSESLGRMAGAVAHHFNNQLGAVIGNLEMVMLDLPEGQVPGKHLKGAMNAAKRAAEVSTSMLTYLGHSFDQREDLDLGELCRRTLPVLQVIMPKNVVLETQLPSPGPIVNANANQLQQILTNLVTNAWEACDNPASTIRISISTVLPAEIGTTQRFPVNARLGEAAYSCLEVGDTGCGIEYPEMEKIFDPFFSSKFTGRGMGLAVVLGIVRAHAGLITVQSTPGYGSTFRVYFPLVAAAGQPSLNETVATAPAERGRTMLLVEDEESLRDAAASLISRLGFLVLTAKDGVEAVEIFQQQRGNIHGVLCDLTMPRLDGWETLAALRRLSPGLPFILASGYSEAQVMAGEHPEQPQAFLAKPYHLEQLRETIARALTGARPPAKPAAPSSPRTTELA